MYDELYKLWKQELENTELGKLPSNFYSEVAEYLRKLREEGRMLDKRTVKANLIKREMWNAERMINELIRVRYKKLIRNASNGKKIPSGFLTIEEEKICSSISSLAEAHSTFSKNLLHGQVSKMEVEREHKRAVLRFLKDVPAIIGADMKTYGPFKTEDVAALPFENAKILLKQGLAEKVEIS